MTGIETIVVKAAASQGWQATAEAVRQATIDLAGSVISDQGLIVIPGKGAISPGDYATSLRTAMPTAFRPKTDQPAETSEDNLTERYRAEIAATRRKSALPSNFQEVRSRYADSSLTARFMDELAAARKGS